MRARIARLLACIRVYRHLLVDNERSARDFHVATASERPLNCRYITVKQEFELNVADVPSRNEQQRRLTGQQERLNEITILALTIMQKMRGRRQNKDCRRADVIPSKKSSAPGIGLRKYRRPRDRNALRLQEERVKHVLARSDVPPSEQT